MCKKYVYFCSKNTYFLEQLHKILQLYQLMQNRIIYIGKIITFNTDFTTLLQYYMLYIAFTSNTYDNYNLL